MKAILSTNKIAIKGTKRNEGDIVGGEIKENVLAAVNTRSQNAVSFPAY